MQPSIFDEPKPDLPSRGKTAQSLEASRSGARVASATVASKTQQILAALEKYRQLSRQGLAVQTGIPINAICSCVAGLVERGVIEKADLIEHGQFASGATTRETFRIRQR